MRLAQISDLHITEITLNPFRLFSKRFLGLLNWIFFRKGVFSRDPINALPAFLKSLSVDQILLGGDFTSTALPKELKLAQEFVSELPAPWIAVPGNHDHYTYRSFRKRHYYNALSNKRGPVEHKADFFHLADHGVEAHRLKDNWWLIAIDTCRPTNLYSSRGLFPFELEARLTELLSLIPADARILVMSHYPFFQNDVHRHSLSRGEALEALLRKEPRVKVYLQGHTHRHTIADLQPSGLPIVLDGGSCADRNKGTFNLLTLEKSHLRVDIYEWKNGWTLQQTKEIAWTR